MFFAIRSVEVTELVLLSLQHSVGPEQPCKEFPVKAIFPYLFLTFFFSHLFLHILQVYKRNYLSCQEKLGKLSVIMETKARRYQLFISRVANLKDMMHFPLWLKQQN